MNNNFQPYIGPRPFNREEYDIFFGRDQEIDDLLSLIIAHQLVLVYAQSGTGKTSILNVGLIPQLTNEGIRVYPTARVRGIIPEFIKYDDVSNLYIYNTLLCIAKETYDHDELLKMPLKTFLNITAEKEPNSKFNIPRVIFFDQFEELFSAYQDRWQDRINFFEQITEVLEEDRRLRVVFIIREDFIAQFDPYLDILLDKLRIRYRLEPLKYESALDAIKGPIAKKTDRFYGAGVAEKIVTDLLKVNIVTDSGKIKNFKGEFVEPVQLQVICRRLWQSLSLDVKEITFEHIQEFGDITQALSAFYEDAIKKVVEKGIVTEGELRRWFEEKLITSVGTRGTAFREQNSTGGMPNTAVDILENSFVIRGELRGGARWYELTHDRFIEPIIKSNQQWRTQREKADRLRKNLEMKASKWIDSCRDEKHLLDTQQISEAEDWLKSADAAELGYSEGLLTFIQASRAQLNYLQVVEQRRKAQIKAKIARRMRQLAIGLIIMLIVAILSAFKAYKESRKATLNAADANVQRIKAEELAILAKENEKRAIKNEQRAMFSERKALDARNELVSKNDSLRIQKEIAEKSRDTTLILAQKLKISLNEEEEARKSAELEKQKARLRQQEIEKLRINSIAMVMAVESKHQLEAGRPELAASLARLAYIFDEKTGSLVQSEVYESLNQVLQYYFPQENQSTLKGHKDWVRVLIFNPEHKILASGSDDHTIRLWESNPDPALKVILKGHKDNIRSLAFHPNSNILASGSDDKKIKIWSIQNPKEPLATLKGHKAGVWSLAFSPDGKLLASGSADSTIRVWNWQNQESPDNLVLKYSARIKTIAFSPTGEIIFWGSEDGSVGTLHVNQLQKTFKPLYSNSSSINAIIFKNKSDTFVTGGNDAIVRFWRYDSQNDEISCLKELHGHSGPINSLVFTRNGELLASGSSDMTVRLWKLSNLNQNPIIIRNHDRWVNSVAFSLTGDTLFSATSNKTIYSWITRNKILANRICTNLSPHITKEDWQMVIQGDIPYIENPCDDTILKISVSDLFKDTE